MDDPVNRVDVWGLFMEDTPGQRIVKSGVIGGAVGAYKGFRWGSSVGQPVPGAIAGGVVGSGEGMARQTVLEYPPVRDWLDERPQELKDAATAAWEFIPESVRDVWGSMRTLEDYSTD